MRLVDITPPPIAATASELSSVIRSSLLQLYRGTRGSGDVAGRVAELAVAATSLMPTSSKIVPIIATPRQEHSPANLPKNLPSLAIDFNMYMPPSKASKLKPKWIVPTQIKATKVGPINGHNTHRIYDPSVRVVYADRVLGLSNSEDYELFADQIDKFTSSGKVTPYLEEAKSRLVSELTEAPAAEL